MNHKIKRKFGIVVVLVVIAVLGGYAYYQAKDFIKGPQIIILSPQNGATVSSSLLEIKGIAKNIAFLEMDGRQIFADKEGNFTEELLLAKEYNIIEIKAEDKFNKKTKKLLEIIYK